MDLLRRYSLEYTGDEDFAFYFIVVQLPTLLLTAGLCIWMHSSYQKFLHHGANAQRGARRAARTMKESDRGKATEVIRKRGAYATTITISSSSSSSDTDSDSDDCSTLYEDLPRVSLEELCRQSESITKAEDR
ncbi:hypothetical protein DQ04_13001000 [Trypanosoma grayi]|uniref:hypothetical protein n=1 Tax=Trypanosoma grayi TaxID=71804 RepID=UPI0004F3F493|nr:hypothetical protein DQ04_13001000 [Trypanosoma grayi]KEG06628.1 hypothetical protein DQ04_13001000 [Trypanosoma grayi]